MAKVEINLHTLRRVIRLLDDLSTELKAIDPGHQSEKPQKIVSKESVELSQRVREVLEFYKKAYPRRLRQIKPGQRAWELIRKRLKEGYSTQDCKLAIVGNGTEPWWKEKGLHGISHIFEKDDNFDRFIEFAKAGNKPKKQEDKTTGYTGGSSEFSGGHTDFGD